ncbi:MAG: polysaccharide lyase [Pirellulaceae bacterium]
MVLSDSVQRFLLFFAFTWTFTCAGHGYAQQVFKLDFSGYEMSAPYGELELANDWRNPTWSNGVSEGRVRVVAADDSDPSSSVCLAVDYPQGAVGPKAGGAQWKLTFPESYQALRLEYRLQFGEGFDFVRGGKLPGLAGGTAPTGSKLADGNNGWSSRFMWRTDHHGKSGRPPQRRAWLQSYMKHFESGPKEDGIGEDELDWRRDSRRVMIEAGRWYSIRQEVRMNDVGKNDGQLRVWLDGVLVANRDDVYYRKSDKIGIDVLYFSTFFGGSKTHWGPSQDETIYFDDFRITELDELP